MIDYEQMELDFTLEIDRSLKDNMQNIAKFALGQIIQHDRPEPVRNRHEGYGIEAEYYENLQRSSKAVNTEMKALLAILPNSDGEFMNYCGSLYNAAIDNACASIKLAAHAQRIMTDLYEDTPIEQYAASLENENADDGFSEVEDEPQDAEELNNAEDSADENKED